MGFGFGSSLVFGSGKLILPFCLKGIHVARKYFMDIRPEALFEYLLDDLSVGDPHFRETLRLSDDDYFPGATSVDVAKLRMAKAFYKKFIDTANADRDDVCLRKFVAVNLRCAEWKLDCRDSWDEVLFGEFMTSLDNFLHPRGEPLVQSYYDLLDHGRCGPGASIGANGEDFYTKLFASKLSASSPTLYELYRQYVCWFPDWMRAEFDRLAHFGEPQYIASSSFSFVRKNRNTSRSICTEPSLNMFFQLGLGAIIEARLRSHFGIDFSTQPDRNRRLACIGSIDESIVTIDLESASDSMSLRLCDRIFPEWFLNILETIRTPFTRIRGDEVALNMVSTMGNGFTFPLQTTVFSCIVRAAASARGIPLTRADAEQPNWGVFGDDIACPREISSDVCRLLRLLGFVVNDSKSYFVGPFRESCGHEYYNGTNVRGVYLKTLKTQESRYVAINLLNEWSARVGFPLPRTVGYLVDSVRYLAIPAWENLDAGIRTPVAPYGSYNSKRQRYIYRCREARRTVLEIDSLSQILPSPANYKMVKRRISNSYGLLFSFLGGYVRQSKITLPLKQGEAVLYRTRTKVSPFWGPGSEQLAIATSCDFWERWNTVTLLNLG